MTYNVRFIATINEPDFTNSTEMEMSWGEQPAWNSITEIFKQFLQSQGYVFDIDDRLDVVRDQPSPFDVEEEYPGFPEEEATQQRRNKRGKKQKAKLSKVK